MSSGISPYLQIFGIIATFCIAYYLLTRINTLREELKMHTIIGRVRDRAAFEQAYASVEFYILPDETIEQFLERSKPGLYNRKFLEEVETVRKIAFEDFKDKTIVQIDKLIISVYGFKKSPNHEHNRNS